MAGPSTTSHPRTDVRELSLAEHAVSAFLHAPVAVAIAEPNGIVTRVNAAASRLLGYPAEELQGRNLFRLLPDDAVDLALAACATLQDGARDTVVCETRFHSGDGRLLDVRVTTAAVRATHTPVPHLIMHLEDITEHEDLRRRLQHEATHDPLTGLSNRVRLLEQLQRALASGERHGQPVTVLYLDLDDFKAVNDTDGHAAGDRLLVDFSCHLRACVRPEDTVARWGGDEFAVLCEQTPPEQAEALVSRLRGGSWAGRSDVTVRVGVTVGVATSPDADGNHRDAEQLLHAADSAMYLAKARQQASEQVPHHR